MLLLCFLLLLLFLFVVQVVFSGSYDLVICLSYFSYRWLWYYSTCTQSFRQLLRMFSSQDVQLHGGVQRSKHPHGCRSLWILRWLIWNSRSLKKPGHHCTVVSAKNAVWRLESFIDRSIHRWGMLCYHPIISHLFIQGYYPLVDRAKGMYMQIATSQMPHSQKDFYAPTIAPWPNDWTVHEPMWWAIGNKLYTVMYYNVHTICIRICSSTSYVSIKGYWRQISFYSFHHARACSCYVVCLHFPLQQQKTWHHFFESTSPKKVSI